MRVAMLVDKPTPYERPTGMGVATFNLSKELAKLGIKVHLFCRGKKEFSQTINNNFHLHKIRHFTRDHLKKTVMHHMKEAFDIFHTHSSSTILTLGLMKVLGLPTIVHMHGIETKYPITKKTKYLTMFTLADKLLCVSKDTADRIIARFQVPKRKVDVLYNGVNTNFFRPTKPSEKVKRSFNLERFDHILLSIGMLHKSKGQHYVIQSLPHILKRHPNLCYVNVGGAYSTDHVSKLINLVKGLNITQYVKFIGPVSRAELVQLINLAEICVHPATREGFCLAVLEEMACGKSVVTFNCTSMAEIITNKENGVLVETTNVKKLARAINELIEDRRLSKSLGKRARRNIEKKFQWSSSASRLSTIYKQLCKVF